MTTETKHGRTSFRGAFTAFSAFLLAFYWLVVATYPEFFIFNPFDDTWPVRQAALLLSLVGWVAISTIPALVLFRYASGHRGGVRLLPYVAAIWPVSVVINQVLLFIRDGVWYFDYLLNHPIFIATDVLLPALLLILWRDLHEYHGKHEA